MKFHKKTLVDFIIILVAFFLFTLWYEKNINDDYEVVSSTNVNNQYIIYLIPMDDNDEFWWIMNRGASDMANMLGVTYIFDAPEERVVDEQIRIINNAVDRNADAILIAASDPIRVSSVIEDAKARGVKIIYVDSPAVEEVATTIATDNYNAGKIAGEIMLLRLAEAEIDSGAIGIIGITTENITTMERERGFREVVEASGKYELLPTKYAKADPVRSEVAAKEFMEERKDLVSLFGTSEGSSIGIGNALEQTESKLIAIGFDYTKVIQEFIDKGILQATLMQNPYSMGYLGVAEAIASIKGFNVSPEVIDTGITVIDKDTPKYLLPRYP